MVIALDKQLENYTSLLFILIWKPQPGSRGSFSQMFLLIRFLENCSLFLRERLQRCHAFLVAFSITCPLGSTSLHTFWMNHRRGMRGASHCPWLTTVGPLLNTMRVLVPHNRVTQVSGVPLGMRQATRCGLWGLPLLQWEPLQIFLTYICLRKHFAAEKVLETGPLTSTSLQCLWWLLIFVLDCYLYCLSYLLFILLIHFSTTRLKDPWEQRTHSVIILFIVACPFLATQSRPTPWTLAHKASLSTEFSRQEH